MRRLLTAPVFIFLFACSGSGDDGTVSGRDAGFRDAGPREVRVETLDIDSYEVVAGSGSEALIGDNLVMRQMSDGTYAIAYGVVPSGQTKQEIHYATRAGNNDWSTEMVIRPAETIMGASGTLVGLGFDLVNDAPHIAYLGGDDDMNVLTPFPTDLALATRNGGNWTERVLVDTSGEAGSECMTLQDVCAFGNVVGSHPALVSTGNGFAVVYRDTHGGFADDDLALSDVELYIEGMGAQHVDTERSGGSFSDIAQRPDGTFLTAYNLYRPDPGDDRVGTWVAYQNNGVWEQQRISTSQTTSRVSVAVASDGTMYVAFFHVDAADLVLATSTDNGETWTTEAIDESGKTGLHPSLALDPQDEPVIAYTYCGRTADRDCPGTLGSDSEVRLARREGGQWQLYSVDDGQGFGYVGFFNSLVVDSDGKAAVAFQDTQNSDLVFVKEL